ncbi:MAG TPA: M28 family peptidase [Rhodocyclaceae bacterium]|nr:M28 family peptidase [Rhodocyclaceae bacterium]
MHHQRLQPAGHPAPERTADHGLAARLRGHVEQLAGIIGERNVLRPRALAAAADYIRSEWQRQAYLVAAQGYQVGDLWCENLVIEIKGQAQPNEIILLGAHYDSIHDSPGADDNASGVAALLELSKLLIGFQPGRTLRLAAFVNEEPPFFYWGRMGSNEYATAARARGENISLMLSLEMLGYYDDKSGSQGYPPLLRHFYPDRGNFIGFVSNLGSRQGLQDVSSAFSAHSDFPCERLATFAWMPGVAWSDQISFWRMGYPGVMVTDTAFYRNPHYHSATDTPETLDYGRMAEVVEGLAGAIVDLAGSP